MKCSKKEECYCQLNIHSDSQIHMTSDRTAPRGLLLRGQLRKTKFILHVELPETQMTTIRAGFLHSDALWTLIGTLIISLYMK